MLNLTGRCLVAIFQLCVRVVLTVWEGSWGNATRGFYDMQSGKKPFVFSYAGKKWNFSSLFFLALWSTLFQENITDPRLGLKKKRLRNTFEVVIVWEH